MSPFRHLHFDRRSRLCAIIGVCLGLTEGRGLAATNSPVGELVDLAPFGVVHREAKEIWAEWENPREIHAVRLVFPSGQTLPPETVEVEWWGSVWPESGTSGLGCPLKLDDHWNGQWVKVAVAPERTQTAGVREFKFPPLTRGEWARALPAERYSDKQSPRYRTTLKVRVVSQGAALPEDCRLVVFGRSRWDEASFDVRIAPSPSGRNAGRLEVINGKLLELTDLPGGPSTATEGTRWFAETGSPAGVRARVLYARNDNLHSNDLTRVTIRIGDTPAAPGFSLIPQQVLIDGIIRLPDLGAEVARTGLDVAEKPACRSERGWKESVRRRIPQQPEASCNSAMAAIPRLAPSHRIPIGVPSAEQEVFIDPNGNWAMLWPSLNPKGRESPRCPFREPYVVKTGRNQPGLYATLDTSDEPDFDGSDRQGMRRRLEEDSLPLIHAEWRTGPIRYHLSMFATILLGDIGDDQRRRGDEAVVLLGKLEATNTSNEPKNAIVNLRYSNDAPLALKDDGIIAIEPFDRSAIPEGLFAQRGQLSVDVPVEGGAEGCTLEPAGRAGTSEILRWKSLVRPGQTRTLYLKSPYVDLLDARELERLETMSYEDQVLRVLDYWRKRMAAGMQIEVPVPALNQFYAANLWHNLITTDRDPETGLYNQFVGTWGYMIFANETVMIARSMDMRGEHIEAERFLEPMLRFQGQEPLPGCFSTQEGVFRGAGKYTHGRYAMNHGFVLWGLADHYLFTRDRAYLERIAPQVIKGCDFLINERRATRRTQKRFHSRIAGLAPACTLEDIEEYKYWFAPNCYFYLGLKRAAQALSAADYPEGQRIAQEAQEYRRDIEAALREATTRSAVVHLRDGRYIPFVPSHAFEWEHLTGGWVRDSLYCSVHAATAEVVSPEDPIITWMLDELEDNVFFSKQSGFGLEDVDRYWFERGGITKQPCLVDAPVIYMARDEIPAALRAFWNSYALLIYPDMQCLAEWAPRYGHPGGPFYKTSDESRFVMWLRQLLIWENGDHLWLARGAPRGWLADGKQIRIERAPTLFGTAGLLIRSEADSGTIHALITPPLRNPPAELWLRLRHPDGKQPERVFVEDRPVNAEDVSGEDVRINPMAAGGARAIRVRAEYGR